MKSKQVYCPLLGVAALVLATGCASTGPRASLSVPRPPGVDHASGEPWAPSVQASAFPAGATRIEPEGALTLEQATTLALTWNPELAAFAHGVRAGEGRARQALRMPNPVLELGMSEYDRDGQGFDAAEMEIAIGQLVELGGKRRWRARVADAEGELAGWDYERKRLDVFAETSRRFMAVVASQERFALAEAVVDIAEKTAIAVQERVRAGKEPPLQAARARAALEMARLDGVTSHNTLEAARAGLAAMWGAETVRFGMAEGSLEGVSDQIPALTNLQACLAMSPELARWDVEIKLHEAALAAERAARIPDLEATFGLQRFEEDGTDGIAMGVGLPLPVFNRNRGHITAAREELERARAEERAARVARQVELVRAHADFASAHKRVEALGTKVVPAIEQAFDSAHEGYRQGKLDFLDMLDAQRGLFEAKAALLDAQADYHDARVGIERITATSIQTLIDEQRMENGR